MGRQTDLNTKLQNSKEFELHQSSVKIEEIPDHCYLPQELSTNKNYPKSKVRSTQLKTYITLAILVTRSPLLGDTEQQCMAELQKN